MASLLPWLQIGLSIVLVALVLLQQTDASLGAAFGASGGEGIERSRRGLERTIFQVTIIIAILFSISVFASLLVQ
ncbi:MAG: preprotein translocase subunit SecG [Patescibacteria group bacterium]